MTNSASFTSAQAEAEDLGEHLDGLDELLASLRKQSHRHHPCGGGGGRKEGAAVSGIVIVHDMGLIGFDAPCFCTLDVDKLMRGVNWALAINPIDITQSMIKQDAENVKKISPICCGPYSPLTS